MGTRGWGGGSRGAQAGREHDLHSAGTVRTWHVGDNKIKPRGLSPCRRSVQRPLPPPSPAMGGCPPPLLPRPKPGP